MAIASDAFEDEAFELVIDRHTGFNIAEVERVLRPGGVFVCTFSNRCFPTKVIRGWLANDDAGRVRIVGRYFQLTDGFGEPTMVHRNPGALTDPLYAVWATKES